MKKYLMLLFLSLHCKADPFYEETIQQNNSKNAENQTKLSACKPNKELNTINLPIGFSQLKLVGLVEVNNQYKALFVNKENQLIVLQKDDYLSLSEVQIENIDLKSFNYIDWHHTEICEAPNIIQIKL
ncbi:hypothetical protein A6B43_06045 [Vespertiliibacter pulmonis]|uniref:Pilus assembly protein PilP n=1 Tax=Vespertiliibacter pulmonis TaxID=1443036 RepID=A0A3N4W2W0_9PAST|nr:pilus assembly protein PilP [Vespertiliibacter pulmonis]QLB21111.1 hypothetical protein A6B43_06045 [Vespertiliibacter pulmonis]RPE83787.1 pilus assembly protein PilP [Vespertiliibacter pulmonis]